MTQDEILSLQKQILERKVFINPYAQETVNFSLCAFLIDLQKRNSVLTYDTERYIRKCRFFLKNLNPIEPGVKKLLERYRDHLSIDSEFTSLRGGLEPAEESSIPKLVYPLTIDYVRKKAAEFDESQSGLNILEFGPWMGSITSVLNRVVTNHQVHVYDQFIWEDWMYDTCLDLDHPGLNSYKSGDSFVDAFRDLVMPAAHVHVHEGDILNHNFDYLDPESVIMVIQDFTDDFDATVAFWSKLRSKLIPNESIVITPQFGNLHATGLVKFHSLYKSELVPLHRASSTMRSFLYKPQ